MEEVDLDGDAKSRIESKLEVSAYIQNLKYALKNGAKINFQAKRVVDKNRDDIQTNILSKHYFQMRTL